MLKRDKILILGSLFLVLIYGCKRVESSQQDIKTASVNIIGKDVYEKIISKARDSLALWKQLRLENYIENKGETRSILDTLLCFNSTGTKFISCLLGQVLIENASMDGLVYFYGVNIEEKWHYFAGATVYISRGSYVKNIHTPLSFEKLHEIAIKNIYSGYLQKNTAGQWEIDDGFFERIANKNPNGKGYGPCFDCKTEDEYYLYLVKDNWTKRDTGIAKQDSLKM